MGVRKHIIAVLYRSSWLRNLAFNPLTEYHQWRLRRFVHTAATEMSAGQRIIDIGAGEQKYRSDFAHCEYVSNDLCIGDIGWNYRGIDIVSSAYDIPVEASSFDAVLCIQVLEHLDAPDRAFQEFGRVLKQRGRVYVSAPLLAGEHQQPHDFFRYTRYGYAALGGRHGFRLISASPHGGSIIAVETLAWAAFWEMLPIPRQSLPRYAVYLLLYPLKLVTGSVSLLLDMLDRKKSMTINYDVVFEKL
jgi:SAM-dependent methyltransferase